uniref:Cadherin domain-containing protein n=1 Tax=Hymenolepis diminuta TaxID=6216 RepID=A0A0R3SCY3_HYMDI
LATIQSGRSTIQAEHHDRKVQLLINAVDFRRATKPYFWSVFFFTLFLFTLFLGLLITCLRHVYMNLILSVDIGESIGPLLCGLSFLFLGAGFKFLYDAYQTGARERMRIKATIMNSAQTMVDIDPQHSPNRINLYSGSLSVSNLKEVKYVPDSAYTVAVKVSTPPAVDTT